MLHLRRVRLVAGLLLSPGRTEAPLTQSVLAIARSFNQDLVYNEDSPLKLVERTCRRVARSDATVLLSGETGTGKEVFARLVHANSGRASGPFVAINCGAIPESLIESELFGYVRGAFTGASTQRKGRFAHADGGTLFLDEIGELPLSMQVKLLRVLQERSFEPVGASEPVPVDFRLIAATNRDLAAEVEAGRFRRDLYYRLLVCPLELPPLRERRNDVRPLFHHFWSARGERRPVAQDAIELLSGYAWPGNVRELQNLVERLSVCVESPEIRVEHLPPHMRPGSLPPPALQLLPAPEAAEPVAAGEGQPVDLPKMLREIEERYISAALRRTGGSKKAAADLLGLQRTTLVEKLRRWGWEEAR